MKKFAFYVSGKATRLKKFLELHINNELLNNISFILIDNRKNKELKSICKSIKMKLYEVDLKDRKDKNSYISNKFLDLLRLHNIDYAFVFADKILVGDIFQSYSNRLINFHPSILPSHKGLYAIDKALNDRTFLLGNSAHFITKEIDGGAVIMQNIFPSINFTGYDEVLDKQIVMLLQLITWINDGRLKSNEERVYIKNASYSVNEFIPNLEIIND